MGKIVILNDNTEQILLLEKLRILASRDELTGLFNRRAFNEHCQAELQRSIRYPAFLSFVLVDVDNFKLINDTHGHSAGDRVLRSVADIFRENVRETDIVGRFGGEEFAFLLPETLSEQACAVAERLRLSLGKTNIVLDNREFIAVTASFGVFTAMPGELFSLDEIVKHADEALYQAKTKGKNCVYHYRQGFFKSMPA